MAERVRSIINTKAFQAFLIAVIALGAIGVGLETNREFAADNRVLLHVVDQIVLWVFVGDLLLKMLALSPRPWRYFKNPWHVFDVFIVVTCALPLNLQYGSVWRLARPLRVLKIITVVPRLQLIVAALLKGIPSLRFVGLLLGVHIYIFAVLGTSLFGGNDPVHFGSLSASLLTLFQLATLEGWVDIMHIQTRGCHVSGYEGMMERCTAPATFPWAPAFFVIFIATGTMIILNLLIGVIMKGMEEARDEANRLRTAADGQAIKARVQALQDEIASLQGKLANISKNLPDNNKK